ncbi:MAG: GNAT family N-acetyltransferase [Casimicrobiaceae bacterium]
MTEARVVRHGDPHAFLAAALPLLDRQAAAYGGLIAWARALRKKPRLRTSPGMFWTVEADERVLAFGMQREQGPLVIGDSDPAGSILLAEAIARRHASVPGVLGSLAACEAFASAWEPLSGHAHRLRFRLRNYVLSGPPPRVAAAGRARAATEADLDLVVAWLGAFIDEARVPDDKTGLRASAAVRIAEAKLWLWIDRRPRALLGFMHVDEVTGRIVTVYTPPDFRRRGYARALTAEVATMLRGIGCTRVHLTADSSNRSSNALYASLGFEPAGDHFHFDFVLPRGVAV